MALIAWRLWDGDMAHINWFNLNFSGNRGFSPNMEVSIEVSRKSSLQNTSIRCFFFGVTTNRGAWVVCKAVWENTSAPLGRRCSMLVVLKFPHHIDHLGLVSKQQITLNSFKFYAFYAFVLQVSCSDALGVNDFAKPFPYCPWNEATCWAQGLQNLGLVGQLSMNLSWAVQE